MRMNKWIEAARPRTLPVSASPVLVASAYAYHDGVFHPVPAIICLIFAIMAQISSNYANDYFDYKKGADGADRVGPKRAVASGEIAPKKMLKIALLVLFIACALGSTLVYYGGAILLIAGFLIAILAFAYSAGPFPLAYKGLGDLTVFLVFGLAAVNLTYYVQAQTLHFPVFWGSVAMGLLAINVLLVNNYRDIEQDSKNRKRTTVVIFGTKFAEYFYLFNGVAAVVFTWHVWNLVGIMGWLVPLLFLLIHLFTWMQMRKLTKQELNPVLGKTARNQLIFALFICLMLFFK